MTTAANGLYLENTECESPQTLLSARPDVKPSKGLVHETIPLGAVGCGDAEGQQWAGHGP